MIGIFGMKIDMMARLLIKNKLSKDNSKKRLKPIHNNFLFFFLTKLKSLLYIYK